MCRGGITAMGETKDVSSRRTFLKDSGRIASVSTLAGMTLPYVHAAENNTIQLALVGCGGRGSRAAANGVRLENGPLQLRARAGGVPPEPRGRPRRPARALAP